MVNGQGIAGNVRLSQGGKALVESTAVAEDGALGFAFLPLGFFGKLIQLVHLFSDVRHALVDLGNRVEQSGFLTAVELHLFLLQQRVVMLLTHLDLQLEGGPKQFHEVRAVVAIRIRYRVLIPLLFPILVDEFEQPVDVALGRSRRGHRGRWDVLYKQGFGRRFAVVRAGGKESLENVHGSNGEGWDFEFLVPIHVANGTQRNKQVRWVIPRFYKIIRSFIEVVLAVVYVQVRGASAMPALPAITGNNGLSERFPFGLFKQLGVVRFLCHSTF